MFGNFKFVFKKYVINLPLLIGEKKEKFKISKLFGILSQILTSGAKNLFQKLVVTI